jgi:hypothetical protein
MKRDNPLRYKRNEDYYLMSLVSRNAFRRSFGLTPQESLLRFGLVSGFVSLRFSFRTYRRETRNETKHMAQIICQMAKPTTLQYIKWQT